jgi:uncharacterized protein
MTRRTRPSSIAALALLVLTMSCGGTPSRDSAPAPSPSESPVEATLKWRAKHEEDYRRDYVTIAGLHRLKPGTNTAGSAPTHDIVLPASTPATLGRFILQGERVRFEPAPAARVLVRDQPVTAPMELRDDRTRDRDELAVGNVRIVVHTSGDSQAVRVRDPEGAPAKTFAGFSWFPIDLQYRVVGRFLKDSAPQRLKVLNTFGDLDEYDSEGVVEFALLGQTLRLRPFTTRPKRFYFVFRDASSGQETYEAARFVYADLLDDGTAVLDFNQAYNPPCAFNPYTTCPIPLRENRLPIKVLAGEKAYAGKIQVPAK